MAITDIASTSAYTRRSAREDWFFPGISIAADPSSPGNRISRLVTGDLNNDGYPDIATSHGFRTAGVYLNNGDQSFAPEVVLSESWWPVSKNIGATSIALGDLDLDGNLDLVIPIYAPTKPGETSSSTGVLATAASSPGRLATESSRP
jgi:hypothetical protein